MELNINNHKTEQNNNSGSSNKSCPTSNKNETPEQSSSTTQSCASSIARRRSSGAQRKARYRLAKARQKVAESSQTSANFGNFSQIDDQRNAQLFSAKPTPLMKNISSHTTSGQKRQREESPHRDHYNPKRNKFWTHNNDSSSAQVVDESLRCAVINSHWPAVCLTVEHLEVFKAGVAREIHEIPDGVFVPRFHDTFLDDGAIVIHCADSFSKVWVEELMPRLYPKKDDPLKVVGLDEIKKLHRATVWVPGPAEDTKVLLKLLERQNYGLLTDGWKVYVDQDVSCKGKTLVLDIDNASIRILKDVDFRPFLGVQRVTFQFSATTE